MRLRRVAITISAVAVATAGAAVVNGLGPTALNSPATVSKQAERVGVVIGPVGDLPALDVLATIEVRNESGAGYDRDAFGYPSSQGNGCDTRDLVLAEESMSPAQISYPGCVVIAGDWMSSYDNTTWTDPTMVEVDHVVALKEAWDSGASAWSPQRLFAYANDLTDPRTLRVVSITANRSKGAADPSNWLPSHTPAVCGFLGDWVAIKARWGLSMDSSEHGRIRNTLTASCPGWTIEEWQVPEVPDPEPGGCDPSYPTVCIPPPPPDLNCGDIPHRNFVVLEPDPHGFDRNNDGIGCSG